MTSHGRIRSPPASGFVALTGTPGTGKSSVARILAQRHPVLELADLPHPHSRVRRRGASVTVDLVRLARNLERVRPASPAVVLVGHLSHLLPVSNVVVLRCHPIELRRRLEARGDSAPGPLTANLESEVTDVVLWEALRAGVPVSQVDTSERSIRSVAREVERILSGETGSNPGFTDWLADPDVTEQLLPRLR